MNLLLPLPQVTLPARQLKSVPTELTTPARLVRVRRAVSVCSSQGRDEQLDAQQQPAYPYNSGDPNTRGKATLEQVFGPLQGKEAPQGDQGSSWNMGSDTHLGWQINERNLVWNDALKVGLIKRVAANELQLSDVEMDKRLEELAVLLPGLVPRLLNAPPKLVAKAAANVNGVAERLLELKLAFPQADILAMVNNRLSLLVEDQYLNGQFTQIAAKLEQLLPGLNVGVFVADFPLVLDVDDFERAIEDVKIMGLDPVQMLRKNPSVVLAQVKLKNLSGA